MRVYRVASLVSCPLVCAHGSILLVVIRVIVLINKEHIDIPREKRSIKRVKLPKSLLTALNIIMITMK